MKKLLLSLLVLGGTAYAQTVEDGILKFEDGTIDIKTAEFNNRLDIRSIEFPSTLKTIGSSAFSKCSYLKGTLVIPDGVETIKGSAFRYCVNLRRVVIPESVTSIEENAFHTNTIIISPEGSAANLWAIENNRDYQYTEEGLPVGVTEMFQDFFFETVWNQRGGKCQYTPENERVGCGNLSDAMMRHYWGINFYGSKCYNTSKDVYFADFDEDPVDMDAIPDVFSDAAIPDSSMLEADKYLWYQTVTTNNGFLDAKYTYYPGYSAGIEEHSPVRVEQYEYLGNSSTIEKTKEWLEDFIIDHMKRKIPVMMKAKNLANTSNHGWIIDGARMKDGHLQVHSNYGWSLGVHNGWIDPWDRITNGMIDYEDPYRKFRVIYPLEGEELANWEPYRLTDEQKAAIKAETYNVPTQIGSQLYFPAGTVIVSTSIPFVDSTSTSVSLPLTLRSIGPSAFKGHPALEEVSIHHYVENVGIYAFQGCKSLKKVTYDSKLNAVKYSDATAPFMNCENLESIVIGENVTTLPQRLFQKLPSLSQVTIPSNVESIGFNTFYYSGLKNIDLQSGLKVIGSGAFEGTLVDSIYIPSTVDSIASAAFRSCDSLKTISYNASNTVSTYSTSPFAKCANVEKVIIGENVSMIQKNLFRDFPNLKTVKIPGNVKSIGHYSFNNDGLESVKICEGVETIGESVFLNNAKLTEIWIPQTVSSIGSLNAIPKTAKIYCVENSYAHQWAVDNKRPFEITRCVCTEPTGEALVSNKTMEIYPNPTTDSFVIKGVATGTAKLYDASGKMVKQIKIDGDTNVNIEALPQGVYMLDVNGEKTKIVKDM
ncbi:MAG: leucine-rich repeat domain-containing protein [Paludibacteraceae bacterium]|nr:leucine-rich repeat domain-containing protein [Paludibacteraceae bacterium]